MTPTSNRPYASIDDATLATLARDARGRMRADVRVEQDYRQANPQASRQPVLPADAAAAQQAFLAQQAWSGLSDSQRALVTAHTDAQVAMTKATEQLAAATRTVTDAGTQFASAHAAIEDAIAKQAAVVDALPAGTLPTATTDLAAQVAGIAEAVAQVTTDAASAAQSLSDSQTAIEQAVVSAVAVDGASDVADAAAPPDATPAPTEAPAPSQAAPADQNGTTG